VSDTGARPHKLGRPRGLLSPAAPARSDRRFAELQGQGIGSALVRASLDAARALGEPVLLLEGNPKYYARFGFVRADELGLLPPPEALYDWAFQVAVLDAAAPLPQGHIVYPPTFA